MIDYSGFISREWLLIAQGQTHTQTHTNMHTGFMDESNFKKPGEHWPKASLKISNGRFVNSLLIFGYTPYFGLLITIVVLAKINPPLQFIPNILLQGKTHTHRRTHVFHKLCMQAILPTSNVDLLLVNLSRR